MLWKRRQMHAGRIWIFCDGSPGGETGPQEAPRGARATRVWTPPTRGQTTGGAGAVALSDDGQILHWKWQQLSRVTNNEAEYAGLLLGLALAQELRAEEAICVLDSEVVVGQMEGWFAVNSHALLRWHWQACAAMRALPRVEFRLIPREWNRLADGLAGQAGMPWDLLRRALEKG